MEYSETIKPVLPLRGLTVLPYQSSTIDVGRLKSIGAIDAALQTESRHIVLATQVDPDIEDPSLEELYPVAVIAQINNRVRLPGGSYQVTVKGIAPVYIERLLPETFIDPRKGNEVPFMAADFNVLADEDDETIGIREFALARRLNALLQTYSDVTDFPYVVTDVTESREDRSLAYRVGPYVNRNPAFLRKILEERSIERRFRIVSLYIDREIQIVELDQEINEHVRYNMDKQQKEFFLREKIRAIHEELGDKTDPDEEVREMQGKLKKLEMDDETRAKIAKEIVRYGAMPPMMPEASILRNYLDWVLSLPWNEESDDMLDMTRAKEILDEDHYGLEKIKERILEFLAVRIMSKEQSGSILCLVGPPGVGKTSLATSIAKAMNRKFVRASLGGVHDEAEIRGHRRTYIGALPGRMIQGLRSAGTKNPVFLLDEIDKLASDYKGDPSAALLEVLDPEQNKAVSDHFIEVPFDFSKVFWITTANVASDIPRPLLDRMEVIQLSSYMEEEKLQIAKKYLLPKHLEKTGMSSYHVKLSDAVLRKVISEYTRESGVRLLEKSIDKVCRKLAYWKVTHEEEETLPRITVKNLEEYMGPPIYIEQEREKNAQVGLVCGLAWTAVGGVTLPCEAAVIPGTGKLNITGLAGKVMQESSQAALTYIRNHAEELGIEGDFHKTKDIHVHLPEGATPKDGPSAGITMTLAIVSALTNRKVRSDLAMTGEVTLRGRVLPIGGLKEKLLAALRYGIKEVFIPQANVKDLVEIPEEVKEKLIITPVKTMEDVLAKAFVK